MKTNYKLILVYVLCFFTSSAISAQKFKLDLDNSAVIVNGTSNLHDWHITSKTFRGTISFDDLSSNQIKALSISVPSETLKSGKKGMDKNTYKALNTDDFKNITFKLNKVTKIESKDDNKNIVYALGDLTIAGNTNTISIDFEMETYSNRIIISGEKRIKMTDFKVEPPSALFGTITTGDEICIKFKSTFNKN